MYTFVTLSLALGASALVVPRSSNSSCSFELTASGGESGTIGQLSDGQNRIGGGLSPATFTIDNGGITDAAGRGCILTPSVEQFQCDQGVGPTYGFSIASNGSLEHAGSSIFYGCPASDTEWNLYTTPVIGQLKCVEISLTASGCYSGCAASSVAPASTVTVYSVSTTTVYDCAASSAAGVVPSAPAVVASSAPVVQSSVPAASVPAQTVPAQPAASSPAESIPAESTPVAESSQASVPVVASSVPAVETTAPAASVPVVATTEASTPVEVSSTPAVQATTIVSVEQSSVPAETTATVVPVEQTSSIYVQTSVPAESPSTATPIQESTQVESSTVVTPVEETTSVYSHSYVVPPVSSTSVVVVPTTALTTSIPIATSSRYWANTTYASTTSTPIASSVTSSASSCVATTLSTTYEGNYEYPHLIIPISSATPDTAAGTQYFGTISSNTSTIFNFDIPSSYSGSTCNLIFLLPLQSELETSSYTFSGAGTIDFEQMSSVATESTTYDNAPSVESDLGTFTLTEGSSTLVKSFECSAYAGGDVAFEMRGVGDTYLYFFQDWNPSPLGLYITYC